MIQVKNRAVKESASRVVYLKLGLLVLGISLISTLLKGVLSLKTAYGRVGEVRRLLEASERQRSSLQDSLADVQTREYLEKTARDKLNMQLPGETLLLVPRIGTQVEPKPGVTVKEEGNVLKWARVLGFVPE